jgi:hypothetical protein
MTLEDKVNEAITYHLSAIYNIETVKTKFGEEVFKMIDQIASYATNDTIWAADDDEMSHQETKERLAITYPFLTEASRIKIADVAAYFWKSD